MSSPRRGLVLGVAFLFLALPLAGCLKRGDADEPPAVDEEANLTSDNTNASLPTGQEFIAKEETNKTEEGVGGIIHEHDYWKGKEQVVVFDQAVPISLVPVFERGDNSKVFTAFINLEQLPGTTTEEPALIFEGTGKVSFEIVTSPPWVNDWLLSFRTAGADWTPYASIPAGAPFDYEPSKLETDMPHSFRSLWNWKLQAGGPIPVAGNPGLYLDDDPTPLHVKITVTKSRDVDNWPGHPAFYDGVKERIVADNKQGHTTVQQAADVLVYGIEPDQVVPDKLISMGTATLDVYVNVSNLQLPPGVENAGFQLFIRNASTRPDDLGMSRHNNESDGKTWAYWSIAVDHDSLDSPYQPSSRWSFKVLATPADDSVVYCYRCVPYQMDYTITVIARPDPAAAAAAMKE